MEPKNVMLLGFVNKAVDYLNDNIDKRLNSRIAELKNIDLLSLKEELSKNLEASFGNLNSTVDTLLTAGEEAFNRFIEIQDEKKGISEINRIFDVDLDSDEPLENKEDLDELLNFYSLNKELYPEVIEEAEENNEAADELPNYDSSIMDAINAADRFINNQTSLIEEANEVIGNNVSEEDLEKNFEDFVTKSISEELLEKNFEEFVNAVVEEKEKVTDEEEIEKDFESFVHTESITEPVEETETVEEEVVEPVVNEDFEMIEAEQIDVIDENNTVETTKEEVATEESTEEEVVEETETETVEEEPVEVQEDTIEEPAIEETTEAEEETVEEVEPVEEEKQEEPFLGFYNPNKAKEEENIIKPEDMQSIFDDDEEEPKETIFQLSEEDDALLKMISENINKSKDGAETIKETAEKKDEVIQLDDILSEVNSNDEDNSADDLVSQVDRNDIFKLLQEMEISNENYYSDLPLDSIDEYSQSINRDDVVAQEEDKQQQEEALNKESNEYVSTLIDELREKMLKEDEQKKTIEEEYNHLYDRIHKVYPYLSNGFIKTVYELKDSIAQEYPLDEKIIVLHRIRFKEVESLRQFVEIALNHDYSINADEDKKIVDVFKEYTNTDGKIISSIFEVANQSTLLSGDYEGYRVLFANKV